MHESPVTHLHAPQVPARIIVRSPETGSQCAPLLDAEQRAVVAGDPQSRRHDAGASIAASTGAARTDGEKMEEREKRTVRRMDFMVC